jgi:hypothetical protein
VHQLLARNPQPKTIFCYADFEHSTAWLKIFSAPQMSILHTAVRKFYVAGFQLTYTRLSHNNSLHLKSRLALTNLLHFHYMQKTSSLAPSIMQQQIISILHPSVAGWIKTNIFCHADFQLAHSTPCSKKSGESLLQCKCQDWADMSRSGEDVLGVDNNNWSERSVCNQRSNLGKQLFLVKYSACWHHRY